MGLKATGYGLPTRIVWLGPEARWLSRGSKVAGCGQRVREGEAVLVQCPTDNASRGPGPRELPHVLLVGYAAGGDHGKGRGLDHLTDGGDVRPLQHAVGSDIGVNDRRQRLAGK